MPSFVAPRSSQPTILIAGAGIGGLTTALHLHAAGYTDIHIFEASSTLSALGVGINVQPSAALILRNLGLQPALDSTAIRTAELNFYNRHGDPILSEPRGVDAGYAVPQYSVHRGEFQMLLLDAVKERVGAERVHLNHALASFTQDDAAGTVTATFIQRTRSSNSAPLSSSSVAPDATTATATTAEPTPASIPSKTGALLIACDGINSTARRQLYPTEGPPHFSGRMLWRGCLELDAPYLTGRSMVWAGHADQKFIAYPISSRSTTTTNAGRPLVNWIAELRVRPASDPDTTPPAQTNWNAAVPKSRFAAPFDSWTCGGLRVRDLIARAPAVYEFPMCDRTPVERWSFGRVTLLGDAAHAMYPIGSNGATQAIIDAETLARCLVVVEEISGDGSGDAASGDDGVVEALAEYERLRLPPTRKIVYANRANGPDHVLQLAEERAPDGFADVHDVIPKEELEAIGREYKAVAGFEMENVNRKARETEGVAERLGLRSPKGWVVVEGEGDGEIAAASAA
ncbi:fad nad-binding domain-containing protein [Diplodia corticola]|uniref:Fad nad-binding domain-containing protein n=1 Tax=Diplodia corticola TaxID=236234 RepID=A0A1J9SLH1_9PEZI|nr:fad nad-binding domain-containing protein [Diplodia corticola]OJD40564.1 fad nad-binding domain-containing protein [Diplodia corticola]